MKLKTKKRIQGSISILMIIILVPMMTLSAVIVDSSRINMAKSMVSSAGDLAMNSALADYDTILKDVYGLFAVSQSDEELAANVQQYFEKTLVSYGVVNEAESGDYVRALMGDFEEILANPEDSVGNFMSMDNIEFNIEGVENSSLVEPNIMRSQIVEYMKYRAPVDFGMSFFDSIKAFKSIQKQTEVVAKQVIAQEKTQDVTSACKAAIDEIREYDKTVKSINETDAVKGKNSSDDGIIVEIKDYSTQVNKYKDTWNPNYKEINTLYFVFLNNPQTLDGCAYGSNDDDINATIELKDKVDDAKAQVEAQIAELSKQEYKSPSQNYINQNYMPISKVEAGGKKLTNVSEAATEFVKYEKFIANEGELKYTDVEQVLIEQYKLVKYYENYNNKQNAELTNLENDLKKVNADLAKARNKATNTSTQTSAANQSNTNQTSSSNPKNDNSDEIDSLQSEADGISAKITSASDTQKELKKNYDNCIKMYDDFVQAYKEDIGVYKNYIKAAEASLDSKVSAIAQQMKAIQDNMKKLVDGLDSIISKLDDVSKAVESYQIAVKEWDGANNISENVDDSFHKQSQAEIDKCKSEYDLTSMETLQKEIVNMRDSYAAFYNYLKDKDNYKYGTKKITEIKKKGDIKIDKSVTQTLSEFVTVEEAESIFKQLYLTEDAPSIEISNYYFLNPIYPNQFLRYINGAFPEEEKLTDDEKENNQTIKDSYDEKKEEIFEKAKEKEEETTVDYGYSYKEKKLDATDLPSTILKTSAANDIDDSRLDISTKGGKLNASESMDNQSSALGSVLSGIGGISGIGDAAEATLENAYILDYIFNNFSYNTVVQDEVMKQMGVNKSTDLEFYQAKEYLNSEENIKNAKANITTLSNYPLNAGNNYLYGSEIEYILYGNKNAQKNVTSAKASIYAIRFGFNCIYAFTDSEIRNTCMSVGLSVQAASLGVIPYQAVQIVMQLALAAAESKVDLDKMNAGLKVAVVKSKDTWTLSLSGAINTAEGIATSIATDIAETAIKKVSSGLQNIVDASADNIEDSVVELEDDLKNATKQKMRTIIVSAFYEAQMQIDKALNELQMTDYANAEMLNAAIEQEFVDLQTQIVQSVNEKYGNDPIGEIIVEQINTQIESFLADVKSKLTDAIKDSCLDPQSAIVNVMTNVKLEIIKLANTSIDIVMTEVSSKSTTIVNNVQKEIDGIIKEGGEQLTVEVTKGIKDNITAVTTEFVNDYLGDVGTQNTIGGHIKTVKDKNSSAVASMICFGYKDYLMLFTFIGICANETGVLSRTGDLIQVNIQNAGENGATYKHAKGKEFKLTNAKTYVTADGTVKLKMLFLNMDFFKNAVADDKTDVTGDMTPAATIKYKGLYGY